MKTLILGGGLAGLSLAYFLKRPSLILEKELVPGGLCRSYELGNIWYDLGPHILFSKNKEILSHLTSLTKTNLLRRSNQIYYKDRLIKYPFENDLAALGPEERDYCLKMFLHNPYENIRVNNMLDFFLKNFGEGITNLYLKPYNEKIWKCSLQNMDTQMVERIPKPPAEDIINSAKGIPTEGYVHQLYFHYPNTKGVSSIVEGYWSKLSPKAELVTSAEIKRIKKIKKKYNKKKETDKLHWWEVKTKEKTYMSRRIINCLPLPELLKYLDAPESVKNLVTELKYNSLYIIIVQVKEDFLGENFSITFPEPEIIFHRLSKLNFLGENYCLKPSGSTLLVEITFSPDSNLAKIAPQKIKEKVIKDLEKLNLIKKDQLINIDLKKIKYAYVIYDLGHRKRVDLILNYLREQGIYCCGRFAEFEYLNMDQIIEHSNRLAEKLNKEEGVNY